MKLGNVAPVVAVLSALALAGPAAAVTDSTPPQVTLNQGLLFTTHTILGDNTLNPMIGPVSITFAASDDTGITSLDIIANVFDQDVNNVGTYEVNDNPAARELTPSIALNGEVDAQVSAYDAAGNLGADFATYYPHLRQQQAFRLTGHWYGGRRASWSGGTLIHSAQPGATATYTFNGRSVALIGDYGPDRGALDVSWGSSHQAVDTQGFFSPRAVIFGHRFNSAGSHTVTVTVKSTTRVDLDALIFQN